MTGRLEWTNWTKSSGAKMRQINIHEAKTNLSRLVDQAARGEAFIIAKAGRPVVKVVPLEVASRLSHFGFMKGQMKVPDDFDRMGQADIEIMFGLGEES